MSQHSHCLLPWISHYDIFLIPKPMSFHIMNSGRQYVQIPCWPHYAASGSGSTSSNGTFTQYQAQKILRSCTHDQDLDHTCEGRVVKGLRQGSNFSWDQLTGLSSKATGAASRRLQTSLPWVSRNPEEGVSMGHWKSATSSESFLELSFSSVQSVNVDCSVHMAQD